MNQDVGAHLKHLLYEQDRVFLPGLGTFITQTQEARRDPLSGTIAPPAKVIQFNANLFFDDGFLKRALSKNNSISAKASARVVNEYVKELRHRLSSRKEARIPGVGVLAYDRSEQIQFIPAETNFNVKVFGLPQVHAQLLVGRPNLAPINRPSIPITSSVKPPGPSNWVMRNRALLGGAVFLLVVVFFVVLLSRPDKEAPVVVTNNSPNINVAPQQIEDNNIPTPPPPEKIVQNERTPEAPSPVLDPIPQQETPPPPPQKTVVIIIGEFQDLSTVQRIIAQILQLGYDPHSEASSGGTTLGFKMPYSTDAEVDEALLFAREEFGGDAYVMNK